jgi:hypothetical protein
MLAPSSDVIKEFPLGAKDKIETAEHARRRHDCSRSKPQRLFVFRKDGPRVGIAGMNGCYRSDHRGSDAEFLARIRSLDGKKRSAIETGTATGNQQSTSADARAKTTCLTTSFGPYIFEYIYRIIWE